MALNFGSGLERVVKIMFPVMLIIFLLLLIYSIYLGDMTSALHYLFVPDLSKVTWHSVLAALGQAFFSLSLAAGIVMMYSAYLPSKASIAKCAVIVAIVDTCVALVAGLIIFPIVFAHQLEPSSGPGLIFKTLPLAFAKIPQGSLMAGLFFLALLFAAFTSLVSLMEPAVAWVCSRTKVSRCKSAMIVGFVCWLLSLLTIGSFAHMNFVTVFGINYYDAADFLSAQVMMPVAGLVLAFFAGWLFDPVLLLNELGWHQGMLRWRLFRILLRYLIPLLIVLIFVAKLM